MDSRTRDTHIFIYDGDCGLCRWAARIGVWIDKQSRFQFKAFQNLSDGDLRRYGLTREMCDKKVYTVSPGARLRGGIFAINFFLGHYYPWKAGVTVAYLFPPLLLAESLSYKIFSRYRHSLSHALGL